MGKQNNIRKLRLSLGLSQHEFAKEFDVTVGTICNWEKNKRTPRFPKIRKMLILCKKAKLKLKIEDFLD